jgi:two-component system response regulator HydG
MVPSILIVEDDLTFSTMLKTWLGKKGFEVETASTQAKARKQIGTRDFEGSRDQANFAAWRGMATKNT